MKNYKIVFIGAGNVATHLGLALKKTGQNILQVVSQKNTSANTLAKILNCDFTSDLNKINTHADIYIIAVKDDAIVEVAKQLHLKDKIVVHTSGSISMENVRASSKNYGVFYPLQTFSKGKKVNFLKIPICLEANNSSTFKVLETLAKSISNDVQKTNSEQRKNIHIAAVFACNFSNHMYTIAEEILKSNKLSIDILKPLIEETAKKIKKNSPAEMQTGPAIRGDKKIMKAHSKLITNKKQKQIYQLISSSIIDSKK